MQDKDKSTPQDLALSLSMLQSEYGENATEIFRALWFAKQVDRIEAALHRVALAAAHA